MELLKFGINISQILIVFMLLLIPYSFITRSVGDYMNLKERELELRRENNDLLRRLNGLPPRE